MKAGAESVPMTISITKITVYSDAWLEKGLFTAIENVATGRLFPVYLNSGSLTNLPIKTTLFIIFTSFFLSLLL